MSQIYAHPSEDDQDDGSWPMPESFRQGSWSMTSKSDPRWDMRGRGLVGGDVYPPEVAWAIRERERELGVSAPADLVYACTKD